MLNLRHCSKHSLNPPSRFRQPGFGECRPAGTRLLWPIIATKSFPSTVTSVTFVFACVFLWVSCSFSSTCKAGEPDGRDMAEPARHRGRLYEVLADGLAEPLSGPRGRNLMGFQDIAGAAWRALTVQKDGSSLYDVCAPVLSGPSGGDPHLAKFYKTALGNPALRPLLRRTGLAELKDEARLSRLREALIRARDDATPDWAAIGAPVAELLDTIELAHPKPAPAKANGHAPDIAEIEAAIKTCGAHLLRSFSKNGFIPTYAAFNLIGDADLKGREMLMALTGLNSRGYKNSTLLFNLARGVIARSPA